MDGNGGRFAAGLYGKNERDTEELSCPIARTPSSLFRLPYYYSVCHGKAAKKPNTIDYLWKMPLQVCRDVLLASNDSLRVSIANPGNKLQRYRLLSSLAGFSDGYRVVRGAVIE